jgi:hypothetical protein
MRKTLMATLGAAMLALFGGMGELGSAEAHGYTPARNTGYISINVGHGLITYVSNSHAPHRHVHVLPAHKAPKGKAYGYWKNHPPAHWHAKHKQPYWHNHKHDRHCRH